MIARAESSSFGGLGSAHPDCVLQNEDALKAAGIPFSFLSFEKSRATLWACFKHLPNMSVESHLCLWNFTEITKTKMHASALT